MVFLMFLVQLDAMKCYYFPRKGAPVVPFDSFLPADQTFLRDKHPNVGEAAACDLCVRSATHSNATSSAAEAVDCGFQRSSAPVVDRVCWCHVFGRTLSGFWACAACSIPCGVFWCCKWAASRGPKESGEALSARSCETSGGIPCAYNSYLASPR